MAGLVLDFVTKYRVSAEFGTVELVENSDKELSLVRSEVGVTLELIQTLMTLHWNQRNPLPIYLVQSQFTQKLNCLSVWPLTQT